MRDASRLTARLLISCWLLASVDGSALAYQEQHLKESERASTALIRQVKEWISKSGTSEAKAADAKARFSVDQSLMPTIWVQQSSGSGYEIKATRPFYIVLIYLADTDTITFRQQPQKYFECKRAYDQYLYDVFSDNAKRSLAGGQLKDVNPPEIFSATASALCREYGKLFPIPPDLRPSRDQSALDAFVFLYFHELGHIAKRHSLPNATAFFSAPNKAAKDKAFLDYMKRSRQQEDEADGWAVDQLIEMGQQPQRLFNLPLFGILLASTGIDCAFESISTHSFAITRMVNILKRVDTAAEKKYQRELPKEMKSTLNDFDKFGQKVGETLKCG